MKYLVTGAAGFIGMHVSLKLIKNKHQVLGLDNLNRYYSQKLKLDRLKKLKKSNNFKFKKIDISNFKDLSSIFKIFKPDYVINLAAQAGVRYSIQNPFEYTKSNLVGFSNLLECCKKFKIKHLIFASSSSVYGGNKNYPFKENHNVDQPISYYAASKKSNELMAHAYSHLFKIPVTGLRFFTVYGPWGRPDMFLYLLTKAIINKKSINIFNKGKMIRDFTYIDDITNAIIKVSNKKPLLKNKNLAPYKIFNIGNNKPIALEKFIRLTEKTLNMKAKKKYIGMQMGDVEYTHGSIDALNKWIKFKPSTSVEKGIKNFVEWYKSYH